MYFAVTEEWGSRRARSLGQRPRLGAALLSHDGRRLAGREGDLVHVWSLDGAPARVATVDVSDFDDRVTAFALSADGGALAIGTARGCALVYAIADAPVRTGSS